MAISAVYTLGPTPYDVAWALQKRLAQERATDTIEDTLLLLEHPHTYTLGSAGKAEHLLLSEAEVASRGIQIFAVDRGGDITYHGWGQLVGYPIIRLPETKSADGRLRTDVVAYVRQLETVLIQALAAFGIHGERLAGYSGVWVNRGNELAKIAAIGVKVTSRRVTMHGFALNINPDLSFFEGIIPCGIRDKSVTSMTALLNKPIAWHDVQNEVVRSFGDVFGDKMSLGHAANLSSLSKP